MQIPISVIDNNLYFTRNNTPYLIKYKTDVEPYSKIPALSSGSSAIQQFLSQVIGKTSQTPVPNGPVITPVPKYPEITNIDTTTLNNIPDDANINPIRINMDYIQHNKLEGYHRSGWEYVLSGIRQFNDPSAELILDDYLDITFLWESDKYHCEGKIPYTQSWIGILHHPPNTTYSPNNAQNVIDNPLFQQSLNTCKGIIVLTQYLSNWLRGKLNTLNYPNIPIYVLYHPTLFVNKLFTPTKFLQNNTQKIVQIGGWLRDSYAIYKLYVTPNIIQKAALKGMCMDEYFKPPLYDFKHMALHEYYHVNHSGSGHISGHTSGHTSGHCHKHKNCLAYHSEYENHHDHRHHHHEHHHKHISGHCDEINCFAFRELSKHHEDDDHDKHDKHNKHNKHDHRHHHKHISGHCDEINCFAFRELSKHHEDDDHDKHDKHNKHNKHDHRHHHKHTSGHCDENNCFIFCEHDNEHHHKHISGHGYTGNHDDKYIENKYISGMVDSLIYNDNSVKIIDKLSNDNFDDLLESNIVFLYLVDASGCNTLMECVARNTPIIINKIDPVVEILGESYPLYYTTIEEASLLINQLLTDSNLLKDTYIYMAYQINKQKLQISTFVNDFSNILTL
jgi:hypothetical protein